MSVTGWTYDRKYLAGALAGAAVLAVTAAAAAAMLTLPSHHDPRAKVERPAGDLGTIRFVTTGDFPPFSFLDTDGRLAGYHVDLIRALCEELGAACTVQMRPFEDLAPSLDERRADAAVAGIAPTAALRRRLDFTDAYLALPARFVARGDTTLEPSPESLDGKHVAVLAGSAHEAFLAEHFPNAVRVGQPTEAAARDALKDGTVDLLFADGLSSSFWVAGPASARCCAFRGGPYLDPRYFGEGLRIAYQRGNRRLRRALDHAMGRLVEKGRLSELYLRWFPLGFY